jgi:tetratricopeptide (TPR) repeat protein
MDGVVTLDRRLANFRAALRDAETGPRDGRAEPPRPRRAADFAERLAAAVDGEVIRSPGGTYVRAESPATALRVDRRRLAALPGQPPADVPLVCLDTETTGLGTAAGTYAFLVGLGWWEGDVFRQIQLLLPEQPDEPALLAELASRIPPDCWLVTYNGRGFDWPLLVTRYRMARRGAPTHAGHLDLLPLVRRVFRHRMVDARLRTVEESLLGVHRYRDVEGWEIPGRYLDFLRGGSAAPLLDVTRHNNQDVRSLGQLLAHVETRFGDAADRRSAHPGDLAGLALAFGRERRHDDALDCLDAALLGPPLPPPRLRTWTWVLTARADDLPATREPLADYAPSPSAVRIDRERIVADRARLLRRLGRDDEALEAWRDLANGGGPYAIAAWIEVAKALEHRVHDPAGALAATRAAQAAVERARFTGRPLPRLEADLAIRARRLLRRVQRAGVLARRRQRGTSGSLRSAGIAAHVSRTQSRSGSNEQAIVRRSPASALR